MKTHATTSIAPPAPRTMPAAVVVAPGEIEIREAPVPRPGAGEVRIRLEGCGVCASNIPPWEGRPWFNYPMAPGALGHEGWGHIDAVGPNVSRLELGDRVAALSQNAYAPYDIARADQVLPLPAALGEQPFPGEPLGCAVNIFRRCCLHSGQTVAIVGIGFLGALLTQMACTAAARVIAISRRPFALDVARQMGADQTVPMDDHAGTIERVSELTEGRLCDVVIEAVGKQWPLDLASELTRERGRVIVAGYHQDGPRQINMQQWNWRGLDVINAHERDPRVYLAGMRLAAEEIVAGRLMPQCLYTHVFPIERLGEALAMTRDRPDGFMKALIRYE